MLLLKSFWSKAIISLIALCFCSIQALAASHEFCERYARHALEHFEVAKGEGCQNLNYPVWSMDFNHHYNWCREAPEAQVNKGGEQRVDLLRKCRNRSGQGAVIGTVTGTVTEVDTGRIAALSRQRSCQDYANSGVSQQQQNLKAGCGLRGPQWNGNYNDHFNWCMHGENLKYTQTEQQKRQDALDRCGAGTPAPKSVTPIPIPGPKTPAVTPLPIPSPSLDPGVSGQSSGATQQQMQEEEAYVPPSRGDLVRDLLADPSTRKQLKALPQLRGRSPEGLAQLALDRTAVMGSGSSRIVPGLTPVINEKKFAADFDWRSGVTFTPFKVPVYFVGGQEIPLGKWSFVNVKMGSAPYQIRLNASTTKFKHYDRSYSPRAFKSGPKKCVSTVYARCNCKCKGYNLKKKHPTWVTLYLVLPVAGTYVISINDNQAVPASVRLQGIELKRGSDGANGAGLYLATVSSDKLGRADLKITYNSWLNSSEKKV